VAVIGRALAGRDVPGARELVARIVGRDTGTLDEEGIARAAIESLAESFNDGIVAPAFWLAVGGLPGLYLYKAVNTADSMIGHRDTRYAAFGWAAARADDLLNLVPARLAGLIICLAAGKGLGTMFRFASRHASPNSGWPEAAMAGALRVRLGGPVTYDGIPADRAWLGNGANPLGARALRAAIGIYVRSCALLWILVGGLAWAL
jgi:adenosylcobinamide-phosphate synthase